MKENAKVMLSVVVPIYNTEKYLSKCIESIINQTYSNLEIILINDGSADNSGIICDSYSQIDYRIKVYHRENCGVVETRRFGVKVSCGDYVTFVDGDDWIEPDMYQNMMNAIQNTGADIVTSGIIYEKGEDISKGNEMIKPGTYITEEIKKYIIPDMMFDKQYGSRTIIPSLCTKIFKKSLLYSSMIEMDSRITYGEDAAVTYICIAKAAAITVIESCWYHYVIHADSMSGQYDIASLEKIKIFYEYMKRAFINLDIWDKTEYQLPQYTKMFLAPIIEALYEVKIYKPVYLFPFGDVEMGSKVIIYGAGAVGKSYMNNIKKSNYVKVAAWVDKKYMDLHGLAEHVESPDVIFSREFDYLVIAMENEKTAFEIKNFLIEQGVRENKIISKKPYRMDLE